MIGLVGIIYGWDSSSNPLSVVVNPQNVTTTKTSPTSFSIILSTVDATVDLSSTNPNKEAFGTSLNFTGPTGCDSLMSTQWQNSVDKVNTGQTFISIDFASQGYLFSKEILIAP